jgi:hypothetical protein
MKALVDDVCTKSQCYQVDFGCLDIEMDLKEMTTPSWQQASLFPLNNTRNSETSLPVAFE